MSGDRPANLRSINGRGISLLRLGNFSVVRYIKLIEIGAIFSYYLTLRHRLLEILSMSVLPLGQKTTK